MPALRRGPKRNRDLMRLIEGVSQKMLTQTLRELERNGLVTRIDHREVPPRVDYELTELGRSLADAVRKLDAWARTTFPTSRQPAPLLKSARGNDQAALASLAL